MNFTKAKNKNDKIYLFATRHLSKWASKIVLAMIGFWDYRMDDKICYWIVRHIPNKIIGWCVIEVWAKTTSGKYSNTIISELTTTNMMKRWVEMTGGIPKKGLTMKIAIISDFNIAGQPTALMRAINKYTNHEARCIIAHNDHFQYDEDIVLDKGEKSLVEATEWVKQCDFFHFGRGIFSWHGMDWNELNLLTKENCIIKYYGSELRNNAERILDFHCRTGIAAITGTDWSITGLLPIGFYHLGSYFTKFGDMEVENLPMLLSKDDNTFKNRVCAGSAGSPMKGYDYLAHMIKELQVDECRSIDLDVIAGLDNAACLERKRHSNITFTSLHGAWGISGVESMFMGHIVLSCMDSWIMSLYPDTPTIVINKKNLKDKLREICMMHDDDFYELQTVTRDFAVRNFSTKTILKRYLYLFDLVMNRAKYLKGYCNPTEIYDF